MNTTITSRILAPLFGPLLPIVVFFAIASGTLSLSRLILIIWQWDRVSDVNGLWSVLGLGLRMDVVLLSILILPLTIVALSLPVKWQKTHTWRKTLTLILTLLAVLLVFMEAATPAFIGQYDSRPNRLFIEYLVYPKEVFSTLWLAYKVELFISFFVVAATAFYYWRINIRLSLSAQSWPWKKRLLIMPLVIILLFIGGRSSFDHRAANISTAAFSNDHLVNDLALSSAYNVLYAVYSMRHESDAARIYANMPRNEIIQRVQTSMGLSAKHFPNSDIPTLHHQTPSNKRDRPLNLVIILEESMGAAFVKSLGGLPLTPELERLSSDGIWFSNLYATGTRSVRGIEAVVSGFLPTPARSVVKLGLAQQGFYTLAQTLKIKGYSTEFIYGGESHFDNMGSFFLSNGFDKTVDKHDFKNPIFLGSWGVSDEDLFNEAHTIFTEHFTKHGDQPFFSLLFTTSFHSPFEFPDNRIELYEQPKNSQNNAVKYADYALGQFIKKAKKAAYWDNTVFLIVADHNTRVYGAALVPVPYFQIPGLILGGTIKPDRYDFVASQIDLAPTLLSLIGIASDTPMVGRDLTSVKPGYQGRAIMQYGNNHAYMEGNRVAVHQPFKDAEQYMFENGVLTPVIKVDIKLNKLALAFALWPSLTYKEQRYRLPD